MPTNDIEVKYSIKSSEYLNIWSNYMSLTKQLSTGTRVKWLKIHILYVVVSKFILRGQTTNQDLNVVTY